MSDKKNEASLPYAKIKAVATIIAALTQFEGKFDKNDVVEAKQRGTEETIKVPRLVALVADSLNKAGKNTYAPTKDDVLKHTERQIAKLEKRAEAGGAEPEAEEPENEPATAASSELPDVPATPSNRKTATNLEQRKVFEAVATDTGIDAAVVKQVGESLLGKLSSQSYLLGLVALANSLHFVAEQNDRLPGHKERLAKIDEVRKGYADASQLKR